MDARRAQLFFCYFACQASADGIENRRLPPPLNIFMAVLLCIVDFVGALILCLHGAVIWCYRRACDDPGRGESGEAGDTGINAGDEDGGGVAADAAPVSGSGPRGSLGIRASKTADHAGSKGAAKNGRTRRPASKALSQRNTWLIVRGAVERLLFALTMGLAALALSAVLWVLSLPSIVGRVVRWMLVS